MSLKIKIFVLFILFGAIHTHAQETREDIEKKALSLFQSEEFIEATPLYLRLLSLEPRNPDYNYRYGTCLLFNSGEKQDAFKYLNYSIQQSNKVDDEAFYYLGKAYHLNFQFDKAIKNYEIYKQKAGSRSLAKLNVDRQIEMCRNGKSLIANISETVVLNKTKINKESFFRIYDLKDIGGELIVTEEFQSRQDKRNNHVPLIHFPSHSRRIYYSSYGDNNSHKDIYVRTRLPDNTWSKAQAVFGDVNTSLNEDFPYMHPSGKYLYFSSEGHNSMGGYDIFRSPYDPETNSFGPPENMDISISSPDNDFLYIVDSLDRYAYFASQRESEGNNVHVYNVRVERFPIQMVILKGQFNSTIDPSEKALNITVKNNSGELMGKFNTSPKGDYLINLPKGGRYEFIVNVGEKEQLHRQFIELPYLKEFRPLKQAITESQKDQAEVIIFKNLFDEHFENEGEIIAEAIKLKSKMEVNSQQFDIDSLDQIREQRKLFDKIGLSAFTNVEIHDLIKNKYDNLNERQIKTQELIGKANATLDQGNHKIESALNKADSLMQLAKISDQNQRAKRYSQLAQKELDKAKHYQAEMDNAKVVLKYLETDFKEKEEQLTEAKSLYEVTKELAINDDDQLIAILNEHKDFVSEELLEETNLDAHFEFVTQINADLQAQEEMKLLQKQLETNQKALENKLAQLNKDYEAASKRKKEEIGLEISRYENQNADLKNEIKYIDNQLHAQGDFNGQKEALAEILKSENTAKENTSSSEIVKKNNDLIAQQDKLNSDNEAFALKNDIDITEEALNQVNEDIALNTSENNNTTVEHTGDSTTNETEEINSKEELAELTSENIFNKLDPNYLEEIEQIETEIANGKATKTDLLERKQQALVVVESTQSQFKAEIEKGNPDPTLPTKIELLSEVKSQLNTEINDLNQKIAEENVIAEETMTNTQESNIEEGQNTTNKNNTSPFSAETVFTEIDPNYPQDIQALEQKVKQGNSTKQAILDRKKQALTGIEAAQSEIQNEIDSGNSNVDLATKSDLLSQIEVQIKSEIEELSNAIEAENKHAETNTSTSNTSASNTSSEEENPLSPSTPAELFAELDPTYLKDIKEIENEIEKGLTTSEELLERKHQALITIEDATTKLIAKKENGNDDAEISTQIEFLTQIERQLTDEIQVLKKTIEESEVITDENEFTPEAILAELDPEYLNDISQLEKDISNGTKAKKDLVKRKYIAKISVEEHSSEAIQQKESGVTQPGLEQKIEALAELDEQLDKEIDALENEIIAEQLHGVAPKEMSYKDQVLDQADKGFKEQISSLLKSFHSGENNYEELLYAQEVHLSKINTAIEKKEGKTPEELNILTEERDQTLQFIEELKAAQGKEEFNINKAYKESLKRVLLNKQEFDLIEAEPQDINEANVKAQALENIILQLNRDIKASNNSLEIRYLNIVKKELVKKRRNVSFEFGEVTQTSEHPDHVDLSKIQEEFSVELSYEQKEEFKSLFEAKNKLLAEELENPSLKEDSKHQEKIEALDDQIASKESIVLEKSIENLNNFLNRSLEQTIDDNGTPTLAMLKAQQNKLEINQLIREAKEVKDPKQQRDLLQSIQTKQNATIKEVRSEQKEQKANEVMKSIAEHSDFENISPVDILKTEKDIQQEQKEIGIELLSVQDQIKEINAKIPNGNRKEKAILEENKEMLVEIESLLQSKFEENASHLTFIDEQKKKDAEEGIDKNAIETQLTYVEEVEIAQSEEYKTVLQENNKLNQLQHDLKAKEAQLISEQNKLKILTSTKNKNITNEENVFTEEEKKTIEKHMKQINEVSGEIKTLRAEVNKQLKEVKQKLPETPEEKAKIENMIARDVAPINEAPTLPVIATGLVINPNNKNNYSDENPIPLEVESPKGLVFRVQIGAFAKPVPNNTFTEFSPITGDVVRPGLIRYVAGMFNSRATATEARNQIRTMGYSDAFVVAYCDGERVPVYRAIELMNSGACVPTIESGQNAILVAEEGVEYTSGTTVEKVIDEFAYNKAPGAAEADVAETKMGLYFTVQVGVYNRPVSSAQLFNITPLITKRMSNGQIRYSTGIFSSLVDAKPKQREAIDVGVTDAFVTAYYKGERISITEAHALLAEKGNDILELNNPTEISNNKVHSTTNNSTPRKPEEFLEGKDIQSMWVSKSKYDEYPAQVLNRYNEEGYLFYYDSISRNVKSFVFTEAAETPLFISEFETVNLYNYAYFVKNKNAEKRSEAISDSDKSTLTLNVRVLAKDLNSDLFETILNAPFNKEMTTDEKSLSVKFFMLNTPENEKTVNQLQILLAKLGATHISKFKNATNSN